MFLASQILQLDVVMRVIVFCLLSSVVFLAGCTPETDTAAKGTPAEVPSTSDVTPAAETSSESDDETSSASAKNVLSNAVANAKAADKKLFVHFGAQW